MTKQPKRKVDLGMAAKASLGDSFKDRLIEEQELRGWTDAGLAHRASEHHPIAANTIWQIKKRGRRVDIDEAHAIAQAFGYSDVRTFVESTSEYTSFQEAFWPLFRELNQLHSWSTVPSHPLNVIQSLDTHVNQDRTRARWREIQQSPNYAPKSLGDPSVMVRELREAALAARESVDQVLDGLVAGLDKTKDRLIEAEQGAKK